MIIPIVLGGAAALVYVFVDKSITNANHEYRDEIHKELKSLGFTDSKVIKYYGGISPARIKKDDHCDDLYSFGNIEMRIDMVKRCIAVCQYTHKVKFLYIVDFDKIIDYRIIETSPGAPKTGKTKTGAARSSANDKKDGIINRLELQIITSDILKPLIPIKVIDRETRAGSYRYINAVKFVDEAYATIVSIIETNKKSK